MNCAAEKNKDRRVLNSIAFSLMVLAMGSFVEARVLPKTAKLVPAETVFLVEIDNFSRLKDNFEKTAFYRFYKDPVMAAFVGDLKKKWNKKIRELDENDIFRAIFDVDVLPQGRVAAALMAGRQSKDTNEPPVLFITQWGEGIDKIKEAVGKMVEKNTALGGGQKSEDYRGVSIRILLDERGNRFCYCFIDDCYIGAVDPDVLKFVIAHIEGSGSPTLADDIDYSTTIAALSPYHDIDFYINLKQLIKVLTAKDTTGKTAATIAALGLDNAVSAGFSIGLNTESGISPGGRGFIKINGTKKGICKILELDSAAFKLPRFVPASTYSVLFLNFNIKKAYDELYNILYGFNPMAASIMHVPLLPPGPDGEPGLQMKADIIDHLGSEVIVAQSINKPFSNNSMPTESLIAISAADRHALEKSLSVLHSKMIAPNDPDARRELLGHTIYLLSPQALPFLRPGMTPMDEPAAPSIVQGPKPAFTITDTHLIIGSESTVEHAIRTLSSDSAATLASVRWFAETKAAVPSIAGLICLQNDAASGELLWWMLKESSKTLQKSNTLIGSVPAAVLPQTAADFSLLPEFDAVRKYFGSSASYGLSRQDGFFFEFKYISPKGLN